MMLNKNLLVVLFLIVFQASTVFPNISLPSLVSGDMVLQQNSEIKIWGWGEPLEEVELTASWDQSSFKTVTDSYANWEITIMTPAAGGPYRIRIKGYNEILLDNVMIGEVWICSGQSNMQMSPASGVNRGEEEISQSDFPDIRLFNVIRKSADSPQNELQGKWTVCKPETMKDFSAVGYYFSKTVHQKLNTPIGIINSSWGGTPAEAWIPAEAFDQNDSLIKSASFLKPRKWGPQKQSVVFNAMIYPMRHLKIAGAIWYQGEDNTVNPSFYEAVFEELILSWREFFSTTDFPFYYVQIAPFNYGIPEQGVQVRDAQRRVLKVPNTGMVVTSDIADINDIHPKEKFEIGLRLANMALKRHYKVINDLVESPVLLETTESKGQVLLHFDNGEGLYFKSGSAELFELAGQDRIFHPAKARIRNGAVSVSSKNVKEPKYVRYAWGNTSISNLFNTANLPASSFTSMVKAQRSDFD